MLKSEMRSDPDEVARVSSREAMPYAWSPSGGHFDRMYYVRYLGCAWIVEGHGMDPLTFGSGATAEAHAGRLAVAVATQGCDACVEIYDAAGRFSGSIRCFGYAFDGDAQALRRHNIGRPEG